MYYGNLKWFRFSRTQMKGDSMRRSLAVMVFTVLFLSGLSAQSSGGAVIQLGDAINNKTVTLTVAGNGGSSGFAVEGSLKNNTGNTININVGIEKGMYLKNSGSGQNMIAIQIFQLDADYYSDGNNNYITVPAQAAVKIVLNAFCANYNLDNPSSDESFSVSPIPAAIAGIASTISKYAANNFDSDDDYTAAMQLAVWRTQGNTRAEISDKFDFTDADWDLSTTIMNSR